MNILLQKIFSYKSSQMDGTVEMIFVLSCGHNSNTDISIAHG